MAQIDSNATKEQLAQMAREFARKREAAARRRAAELARLSEELTARSADGTIWTYVVVDGAFARITSCETSVTNLVVPDQIAGVPVREIDAEALSHLATPTQIVCARGIEAIGPYAFRSCQNLVRLVLPACTSTFSGSWVSQCPALAELVLPGALEEIPAEALGSPSVTTLVIGAGTQGIRPGAFEKSCLETVRIDPANTYLACDGTCIYSADGTRLLALARPVEAYEVAPNCRIIERKAFVGTKSLRRIDLPEGLSVIEELAFANAALEKLTCPPALQRIAARAFLRCRSLQEVDLNEGLVQIGEEAFAGSSLHKLHIPASVKRIDRSITNRTCVRHAQPNATFDIDARNQAYRFDEHGCLYEVRPDGIHLVQFMEPTATSYRVIPGTVAIDDKAFAYHGALEAVELPQGLKTIGAGAFRVCAKLSRVSVPDTLESVGKDAFIDTELEQFHIPASLASIGPCALVTNGSHHEGPPPALREITVDPGNPRFFMHSGILCRRTSTGANAVMFTCSCERVVFPEDLEEVEDYAFNNAFGITELYLNARLRTIGACGLSVMSQIRHVRIDVAEPIEGRTSFVLHFPGTSHSVHGFLLALGGLGYLYLPDIMAQYDTCIAAARDYRSPGNTDNASAYEQVKLIIGRLTDSVLLTKANRERYHAVLNENIEEICADIARHDDRETINQLADLGFINEGNLERVIAAVNRLQDAAMTGFLLEMKRVRFGARAFDFDL